MSLVYECNQCHKETFNGDMVEGHWICAKCQKNIDDTNRILLKAIAHYGEPAQVLKCIEELAELQLSLYRTLASYRPSDQHLLNYIRDHAEDDITICKNIVVSELITSPYKIDEVVLELADVEITTKQVRKILTTEEEFKKAKEFKLNRLEERIKEGVI